MDILIIPKIDFDKLRQSVPAFANVFNELAKQRAVTEAPHLVRGAQHTGRLQRVLNPDPVA
jgi:hypothetical protein